MKCWSEGELRAYIDRELPADGNGAGHRAPGRVFGVRRPLGGNGRTGIAGFGPHDAAYRNGAGGSCRAVAAPCTCRLAMGRGGGGPGGRPGDWDRGNAEAGTPVAVAPPTPAAGGAKRRHSRPNPRSPWSRWQRQHGPPASLRPAATGSRSLPALQVNDTFLALDNDPIEAGVVLRVALGPREVPADVIIDADGRPRAIRLVNFKSNH